jgi:hypothetical protein
MLNTVKVIRNKGNPTNWLCYTKCNVISWGRLNEKRQLGKKKFRIRELSMDFYLIIHQHCFINFNKYTIPVYNVNKQGKLNTQYIGTLCSIISTFL